MSQYPPQSPYDQGYGGVPNYYNGPSPGARPTAVTGVAITGIILGSIGLLCAGPSIFLNLNALNNSGRLTFGPQLPAMSHGLLLFSVYQCILNVIVSLVLLVCSIGALSLKSWARAALMPWSVFAIIWAIIICVVQLMWMNPQASKMSPTMAPGNASFTSAEDIGRNVSAVLVAIALCVVPVLILTLWNRPHVKVAFGAGGGTAPFPQSYSPTYPPNYPGQQ